MTQNDSAVPQSTAAALHLSISSQAAHKRKYHGLLKRSPLKNLRDNLFRFMDYINTRSPSHKQIINFMLYLTLAHIFLISILPYSSFWDDSRLIGKILNVLSVIAFISPKSIDQDSHLIVALVVEIIVLLIEIMFVLGFIYFLRMSKCPDFLVVVMNIILCSCLIYFISLFSAYFGRATYGVIKSEGSLGLNIVSMLFSLIHIVFLSAIQLDLVTPILMFRPQALFILFSSSMRFYVMSACCYSFFTVLGSSLEGLAGIILIFVGSLFILPPLYQFFIKPFVFCTFELILKSAGLFLSAFINTILIHILDIIDQHSDDYIIVVLVLIIVLCYVGFKFYFNAYKNHLQKLCEQVIGDIYFFDSLNYYNSIAIVRITFEQGYQIGHNWTLLNRAIEKYPTDIPLALLYARYASIYPDESAQLQIAARHLISLKQGSLEIKHCIFQIHSILQQRDSSMSPNIKKSLNKIRAKIEKARGQIRYLWECIMRGNTEEIEGLSTHLKKLEEEIVRDYSQLCLVYPNNPYVAHAYSSYLREIMNCEDQALAMNQIYQQLRQGRRTREERCYFFAQRIFPSLPNESAHLTLTKGDNKVARRDHERSIVEVSSRQTSSAAVDTFNPNQEAILEEKLQKKYVESMIESVVLPSMRYGPVIIILLLVIVMPVCIIPVTFAVVNNIDHVREAMTVVMYSSQLRMSLAQLIFLTYHSVMHNTGKTQMPSLKTRWENAYGDRRPLPYQWENDSSALMQSVQKNRALVNIINSLSHNLAQTGNFEVSLNILYTSTVPFSSYTTHDDFTSGDYSLEHIITFLLSTAVNASSTTDPGGFLDNFDFWSMIKNIKTMLPNFEAFADFVVEGITVLTENSRRDVLLTVVIAILLVYLISLASVIFIIIKLNKEKEQVFSVFKALPKSALSAIVTQLNSQKGKDADEEQVQVVMSAQEENALRVLSTSVDPSSGNLQRMWPIIALIVLFTIASVILIVILIYFAYDIDEKYDHINPLFGLIPYVQSQFYAITLGVLRLGIGYEFKDCIDTHTCQITENANINYTDVGVDVHNLMSAVTSAINGLRLGADASLTNGIADGGKDILDLLTNDMCTPPVQLTDPIDTLDCLSYESGIGLIWQKLRNLYQTIQNEVGSVSFNHSDFDLAISWLFGVAEEEYVEKSFEKLDAYATEIRNSTINGIINVVVIICMVVIMACGIAMIPNFLRLAETARWTLRLLLFCQPNIVLQSKSIIKILSNDFSTKEENKEQSGANFYETVVSHLLDGVLFLNNELTILSGNTAVGNILGIDPQTIINKKLTDILKAPKDSSSLKAFFAALQGVLRAQRSPSLELEAEVVRGGENITLLLSVTAVSTAGNVQVKAINAEGLTVLALVIKDMTSTIAANKLLVEEGIKSEKLLLMILPPVIVNKLQNGEKNISFAVKSASIMFVDIVSFTPWCGSHPADYVMSTLNSMFAEFDRILKTYDRMTKIKCIGDCYMCAGGIFDEINQPAEHAKQAISFGIDIIAALKLLNIQLNEQLRIRVGVNTGGPIVAGVLGIEKPTFDILGPAICLAAMMEHHGVPNHVHIPQHCYDLVFGTLFRIKERGDVEVKGKMYHTYIVSGYDQAEQ